MIQECNGSLKLAESRDVQSPCPKHPLNVTAVMGLVCLKDSILLCCLWRGIHTGKVRKYDTEGRILRWMRHRDYRSPTCV